MGNVVKLKISPWFSFSKRKSYFQHFVESKLLVSEEQNCLLQIPICMCNTTWQILLSCEKNMLCLKKHSIKVHLTLEYRKITGYLLSCMVSFFEQRLIYGGDNISISSQILNPIPGGHQTSEIFVLNHKIAEYA